MSEAVAPAIFDYDVERAESDLQLRVREDIQRYAQGKRVTAVCALFSGGNDSTMLLRATRPLVDYAVHINTGIGIEQTRQFVRDTCASWGIPLIEEGPPPGSTYEELVLDQGFPGPAHHWKMYQRLKERALRQARRRFVKSPRQERVVFLAGRRRGESSRRMNIPEAEVQGSVIWLSPLAGWSDEDMAAYRRARPDMPRNEVSALLHMSGECLCGAFAKPDERAEIALWFPETDRVLAELEERVRAAGHPEERCVWGWGAHKETKRSKSGPLCSSCDQLEIFGVASRAPLPPATETSGEKR